MKWITVILTLITCSSIASAQPAELDQDVFAKRRTAFMEKLVAGAIAILPSRPVCRRNPDVNYPYRQESNFYYLSGYEEPKAVLLLDPSAEKNRYVMFVRERSAWSETWTGLRSGTEGAMMTFRADTALAYKDLQNYLKSLDPAKRAIYYPFGINAETDTLVERMIGDAEITKNSIHNPRPLLSDLRLIKNEGDWVSGFQKAINISAAAHMEAFRAIEPGMYEYQIQAVFEYIYRINGSPRNAYPCIIASGPNALILHYDKNMRHTEEDDLVLMDCGAEFGYYAADITRTVPVSGRFTREQREIYEIVLAAQKAGLAIIKPDITLGDVSAVIDSVLAEGVIRLGLLTDKNDLHLFTLHGYSHWLGMDVHDVGAYKKNNKDVLLQPGMVFTVEPGLYFRSDTFEALRQRITDNEKMQAISLRIPQYLNIGIRIEDDILVTEDGCRNLTEAVPREIDDIEAIMAEDPEFINIK